MAGGINMMSDKGEIGKGVVMFGMHFGMPQTLEDFDRALSTIYSTGYTDGRKSIQSEANLNTGVLATKEMTFKEAVIILAKALK